MTLTSQGQVSLFYTPLQKVTQFSLVLTKKVLNKNFNQMGTQKKKKYKVTDENVSQTHENKDRKLQHSGAESSDGVYLALRWVTSKSFKGFLRKGYFIFLIFIWLHWVLVMACGI